MSEMKKCHTAVTQNRKLVDHLHALGPEVLAEFLAETVDPVDMEIELFRYGRLIPASTNDA